MKAKHLVLALMMVLIISAIPLFVPTPKFKMASPNAVKP